MPEKQPDPSTPSADHNAMERYWCLVADLLDGTDAMRAAGQKYLPAFAEESAADYDYRRKTAKYVNIYRDIVENLAANPFSDEVQIVDKSASPEIIALAENIDGCGNSLHVFASRLFFDGINDAVSWIFVDYPALPEVHTLADERAAGARPYWVQVKARDVLAVETATIEGEEQFVHVRFLETHVERDGFEEKEIARVRVLDRRKQEDGSYAPATWELFEEKRDVRSGASKWELVDSGKIGIGVISLVPFIAGRRKDGSWRFIPPMQDAANLQVEHYQAESALKSIKTQCAFPMLAGNGITPEKDAGGRIPSISVGPQAVLYAPMDGNGNFGTWAFIEPTADSLDFLARNIETIEQQLRELGRQPLTAQTGNLTVVTTAFAASKANSVISAWTLNLKDSLERALGFTALWLNDASEPEVEITSDFDIDLHDDKSLAELLAMRTAGDLSQETLWREFKRRGVLSAEFNAEAEMARLVNEMPGEPTFEELQGMGVTPLRRTGTEG